MIDLLFGGTTVTNNVKGKATAVPVDWGTTWFGTERLTGRDVKRFEGMPDCRGKRLSVCNCYRRARQKWKESSGCCLSPWQWP